MAITSQLCTCLMRFYLKIGNNCRQLLISKANVLQATGPMYLNAFGLKPNNFNYSGSSHVNSNNTCKGNYVNVYYAVIFPARTISTPLRHVHLWQVQQFPTFSSLTIFSSKIFCRSRNHHNNFDLLVPYVAHIPTAAVPPLNMDGSAVIKGQLGRTTNAYQWDNQVSSPSTRTSLMGPNRLKNDSIPPWGKQVSNPTKNTQPPLHSSALLPRGQGASAKWAIFFDATPVNSATIRKHCMTHMAPMMYRTWTKEYEIRNMKNDTHCNGFWHRAAQTGFMC